MRLTRKACYGLRAIHFMACQPADKYCSAEEIGRAQEIPEGFLAKVLNELVRAGLLLSRRGQEGGVRLARPASEITVFDVIRVLEGPLAISECLRAQPTCPWMETCRMRQVWKELQDRIQSHLDSVSLESCELAHEESK
jgi:Rrf2 family protein